MSEAMFDEEASSNIEGNGIWHKPESLVGHLLLVWAVGYDPDSPTKYSTPGRQSDVVFVDCVDLDQVDPATGQPGLLGRNCWWRGARLIRDLKPKVGNPHPRLAFMVLGTATKGRPPYELLLASDDPGCRARGADWLRRNPDFKPGTVETSPSPAVLSENSRLAAPAYTPTELANAPSFSESPTPAVSTVDMLRQLAEQSNRNAARLTQGRPEPQPQDPPF